VTEWLVQLDVAGEPKTQGSKRAFIVAGKDGRAHANIVDDKSAPLKTWRTAIATEARNEMDGRAPIPAGRPVELRVTFYLRKPLSAPKTRRTWPVGARSGDVDKLLRAVFDALRGVAYTDDSQVVLVSQLRKDYAVDGWTGALIDLRPIDDAPAPSAQEVTR
jgi:crossover junction endodeoxyribonuclease RusA